MENTNPPIITWVCATEPREVILMSVKDSIGNRNLELRFLCREKLVAHEHLGTFLITWARIACCC
jgi:hypothetical protein